MMSPMWDLDVLITVGDFLYIGRLGEHPGSHGTATAVEACVFLRNRES